MEMMTCWATALTVLLTPSVERVCLARVFDTLRGSFHSQIGVYDFITINGITAALFYLLFTQLHTCGINQSAGACM